MGDRLPTSEDAALERIGRLLEARLGPPPPGETWLGDDTAIVLAPDPGSHLLLTADSVVAGVHLDLSLLSPADVGWKALTVAVSDIGAMGGTPAHALVTLCAPYGTDLEAIAGGLASAAARWRCPVVGGDMSSSNELVITVAVTGVLEGSAPAITRGGARPGDRLFVTGPLGRSAAGLRLLRVDSRSETARDPVSADLVEAHRHPSARIAEGRVARDAGATAMIDISDGLGLDLHRLARASSVGFALDLVPVAEGATVDEAVGGGEDYELLIAAPAGAALAQHFEAAGLAAPIEIGLCTADPAERSWGTEAFPASGYQHRF